LDPSFDDFLRKAGSAQYQRGAEGMGEYEYHNLLFRLAPYESDGIGDTDEWNLFARGFDHTQKIWVIPIV
jgi:hypothetical protein